MTPLDGLMTKNELFVKTVAQYWLSGHRDWSALDTK